MEMGGPIVAIMYHWSPFTVSYAHMKLWYAARISNSLYGVYFCKYPLQKAYGAVNISKEFCLKNAINA